MTTAQLILSIKGITGRIFATAPYLSSATLLLLCTYWSVFLWTSPPAFSSLKLERNLALSFCKIDSRPVYFNCRNAVSLWAAQQALEDL